MNLEDAGRIALANAKNHHTDMAVVRAPRTPGGYSVEWADTTLGRKNRVFVVAPKDTLEFVLAQTTKKYQDGMKLHADVVKLRRHLLETRATERDLTAAKRLFGRAKKFMATISWGRERDETTANRLMAEVGDDLRGPVPWVQSVVEKLDTATNVLLGALQRGSK